MSGVRGPGAPASDSMWVHLPVVDVAAAGGWKAVSILKECYQQPDLKTMLEVVQGGRELRERHA